MKRTTKTKQVILLTIFLILVVISLFIIIFLFKNLDLIVHGELYNFGLQFNSAWADLYLFYANLIYSLVIVTIVATISSLVTIFIISRSGKNYRKFFQRSLVLGISFISIILVCFLLIDQTVIGNLVTYGLEYSVEWSQLYSTNLFSIYGTISSTIAILLIILGISFSDIFIGLKRGRGQKTVWRTLGAIALRNIPRRKLRNSLTILAIVLGVTLMVGVNVAFDSVFDQFKITVDQAVGNVDINIRSSLDTPINQSLLNIIKQNDEVADAYVRVINNVNVSKDEKLVSARIIGVNSSSDFDYLDIETTNITDNRFLRWNGSDAVVDKRLNYNLGETIFLNFTLNSDPTMALYLNKTRESKEYNFTVVGIYHPNPFAIQASAQLGEDFVDYSIYLDVTKTQNMLDYDNEVNRISVKLVDVQKTEHAVEKLNLLLGSDYVIAPTKQTVLKTMENASMGLRSGLQIMSIMALCVAIVIVLNTMFMNVGERVFEIGTLRSQGASTGQVFWIFFSESLILGIIGVSIGLLTGLISTQVFRYLTSRVFQSFSDGLSFSFSLSAIPLQHLLLGALTGMLTVIIGGLFPSLKACKIKIISALRPSMRKPGKQRTALKLVGIGLPLSIIGAFIFIWFEYFSQFGLGFFVAGAFAPIPMIGIILLAAGLLRSAGSVIEYILILFGKTRKIIARNIERNLLRSTICFALIGMSLNLIILMGGAQTGTVMGVESVVRSFSSSDVTVNSKNLISKSFSDNLTNIGDGLIDITTPVLTVPERAILHYNYTDPPSNSSATIVAIDPETYPKAMSMTFSEDTPTDVFEKLNNSGTIILTTPLAQNLQVSVNDILELRLIKMVLEPIYTTIIPEVDINPPSGPSIPGTPPGVSPSIPIPEIEPITIVTYIPTTKIISENLTVIGIAQGAWLEMASIGGHPLSEASYISYNSLNKTFPKHYNSSNMFFIKANPAGNVDEIKDEILDVYGEEYELSATTYNDSVERVSSSIDEMFYILYSVVIFAVANSAIGVAAIMIMNISERKREIGIFRSQGMSRGQVVVSIFGEAACLGFIGFLSGTAVGLIFHRITVSYMATAGFPMPYIIPYDAIWISLIIAILTSIISAVYAANRASKLNIVESLRT